MEMDYAFEQAQQNDKYNRCANDKKDKSGKGGMYRRVLRTPDMQINTSR
jgi:hypothetical protein